MKSPIWSTTRIAKEINEAARTLDPDEFIELRTRSGSKYRIAHRNGELIVVRKGEGDKEIASHPFKGVSAMNRSLIFEGGWETTTLVEFIVYRITQREMRPAD